MSASQRVRASLLRSSTLGLAAAAMMWPSAAFAQPEQAADQAAAEEAQPDSQGNPEMIVTARRRAERIQDTPLSVSAISTEQIEQLNIVRLDGITQLAPALRVTTASGSANAPAVFIRGIGTVSTALYVEPSVGFYLDGVYTPRPSGNTFDLPDISSVEVLRGPQGTLFGRNTTGGAILINTVNPTNEFGAKASLSYGSENEIVASTVVQVGQLGNSPFALRLSATHHSRDGWVVVPTADEDAYGGALDAQSIGAALRGEIGDLTIDLRGRYNWVSSYTGWEALAATTAGRTYFGGTAASPGPAFPIGVGPRDSTYRDPRTSGRSEVESYSGVLTLEYAPADWLTVKSITAWTGIDQVLRANLGGGSTQRTVLNPAVAGQTLEWVSAHTTPENPGSQDQFTQEIQVLGDIGDFNYLVGLYLYDETVNETITTIINSPNAAGTASTRVNRSTSFAIDSQSVAVFGQVGWKPSFAEGRLELVGGIRYTSDDKSLNSQTVANIPVAIPTQQRQDSWDNTGWLGSASFRISPEILIYGRAASSYRSGGYNAPTVGALPFNPETSRSYELGVKTDLFDRRLRFNISAFRTDFDDLQVNGYDLTTNTNRLTNAGGARFQGFEAETQLTLGGFSIDANVGYVDPEYLQYSVLVSGVVTEVSDIARFANVPNWTYHAGAQYGIDTDSAGSFTLRADFTGTSDASTYTVIALAPNTAQVPNVGKQADVSLRLNWELEMSNGRRLTAQIFGENITDHRYLTFVSDFGAVLSGVWNRPAHYGVRVGYQF